jgi:threonine dehydrogenase-like Zn-dependent dehydrogenase
MLAATYTQGGRFEVKDVPVPTAGEGELLVRVTGSAICGTDLKIMRNGHRKLKSGQRIVLGHEFVGVIETVGNGVSGFAVGQRVGVAPNAGCGRCRACRKGRPNYCADYTAFGIDRDGAHAPCVIIPSIHLRQGNVQPMPESVTDADAALLEPLSCVVAGQRAVEVAGGDTVLIFGAGPMGLLHVLLARTLGAAAIVVFDPAVSRLALAEKLGADKTASSTEALREVMAAVAPEGVDVAITAAPVGDAVTQGLELLGPFGRLCAFAGLPLTANPVPMDVNRIHYKNLKVTGTTGGSVEDYRFAMQLVATGRIRLEGMIAASFSMDRLVEAYEAAQQGLPGKVVITAGRQ